VENPLNDLTGAEWLYWTNSLYPTNFPPDLTHPLRKKHGAIKPPELMAEIISFFTKEGELVLDPFAGVGSTLLGAELVKRRAVGIELNANWIRVYQEIMATFRVGQEGFVRGKAGRAIKSFMMNGDCLEELKKFPADQVAAIITDPPYGCGHRVTFTRETNFAMFNPGEEKDFGNTPSFTVYLNKMAAFAREAFRILMPRRYLVILIGDRYQNGEYYPLSTKVAEVMQQAGFKWKGMRIWWNQATQRPLRPYAIKRCYVPNITHQNILIFRKG
jgi:DNA modification methylase